MSLRPDSGCGSSAAAAAAALETRNKSYKCGIDPNESRRRREEDLIDIRKGKRQQILLYKRRLPFLTHSTYALRQFIPAMLKRLRSQYPDKKSEIAAHFKTLFTIDQVSSIDDILTQGILPLFVELLSKDDTPLLQLEVLQILNNFAAASSEHTRVIVELGVVPTLVNLLNFSSNDDIREEIVCALAVIVSDSFSYRDLVLNHGALLPLLYQFELHSRLSMLKVATWCLSSLVRGKPPLNFEQVKPALPFLQRLIHTRDEEVITDACWALSYISEVSIDQIQAIIDAGVSPKLVQLLLYPSDTVVEPALRTLGYIVYAGKHVIDNKLLRFLHQLLTQEHKKSIIKDACWTISNIVAGNRTQMQAVIDANIIPPLVQILLGAEFDIKKEAAWAIFMITSRGSLDNIRYLGNQGCIKALCELLTCPDPMVVSICLKGLDSILVVGEADKEMGLHDRVNIFSQKVDECEGWDKIVNLQTHDNNEIYERAASVLKRFWPENDLQNK